MYTTDFYPIQDSIPFQMVFVLMINKSRFIQRWQVLEKVEAKPSTNPGLKRNAMWIP